ncbi:uncharacterized protein HRG_07365 [Hirsutella rhossiliensis]|uniref:Uncharacterized protein n=1 Tax=Hirsutella rhossiliensis TaxID=111463 RepID=A0A9P8MY50_9HYPO|nr:uncharacterized protein HRG_07365 [Hirsutella rhossiliensis]KAH0961287.1 hypothetical protein HRG_07365 [Hirsutella rhossiliensis]
MSKDTIQRTILTEPQDWDKWLKELRARVDKTIHKLIFEHDKTPLELPERPEFSDFNAEAERFADLNAGQQKAYSEASRDYEGRRKEYLYETRLVTAAPCGLDSHELEGCWQVFEELRPGHFNRSERLCKRAQKAIKDNPDLRKKVEEIREIQKDGK